MLEISDFPSSIMIPSKSYPVQKVLIPGSKAMTLFYDGPLYLSIFSGMQRKKCSRRVLTSLQSYSSLFESSSALLIGSYFKERRMEYPF
jgi:hypothetical protein